MDPASHPVPDSANGRLTPTPASKGQGNGIYANGNGSASGGALNVVRKKLGGYVGFANLPDQVHQKSVRWGCSDALQSCWVTLPFVF